MERPIKKIKFEEIQSACDKIVQDIKSKDLHIDIIMPLLRGGMSVGQLIGNRLKIDDYCFLQTKSAVGEGANVELAEPIIIGQIGMEKLKDKNVLICDDIFDTGRSIMLAEKVAKQYGAKNVYLAVAVSVNNIANGIDNLFIAEDYSSEKYWIIFPWED